jgi:aryl-alcohol dehydrogenase-like predicted oxidoreductase
MSYELAAQRRASNAKIALAWFLAQKSVMALIIGATKMKHLEDAVNALEIGLTNEELKTLTEVYQPHPVLNL